MSRCEPRSHGLEAAEKSGPRVVGGARPGGGPPARGERHAGARGEVLACPPGADSSSLPGPLGRGSQGHSGGTPAAPGLFGPESRADLLAAGSFSRPCHLSSRHKARRGAEGVGLRLPGCGRPACRYPGAVGRPAHERVWMSWGEPGPRAPSSAY